MPPMKVLGFGAWPENLAPEKSKPGCCAQRSMQQVSLATMSVSHVLITNCQVAGWAAVLYAKL